MSWILIFIMLSTFTVLVSSRIKTRIFAVSLQGALLSALYIVARGGLFDMHGFFLVLITFTVKTIAIPIFLFRATRSVSNRLVEPSVGSTVSLLGGFVIAILSFTSIKLFPEMSSSDISALAIPSAFTTVLIGFWILVTKTKATNQVIGFLVLENGVFTFGMTIISDFPMTVELGVLLDLLVGVFVMGIMIYQINKTFDHIDTRTLSVLGDE